jgi:hypothetical protein
MNDISFRQYSVDYKLETYLRIAQLYLEDDDPIQADAYLNRASLLHADTKTENLQILYKVKVYVHHINHPLDSMHTTGWSV